MNEAAREIREAARAVIALAVVVATAGCASLPYRPGSETSYRWSSELLAHSDPQIVRGQPRPVLDTAGWVFGIPSKIVLWNSRIDNHKISPQTEAALAEYLAVNELWTVRARLNQYAPGDDWRRLVANKSVGWGWKYSLGTLSWVGETIFPGRLFGGDHYNPFTNTVHIYSDVPAVAIHEGGHAKDFAQKRYKGTYAAVYMLPLVPLWHEAKASQDALGYIRAYGSLEEQKEAYHVLYPAYGTYVGNAASSLLPWNGTLLYLGGVIPGHIAGRVRASQLDDEESEATWPGTEPAVEQTADPPFDETPISKMLGAEFFTPP